MKYKIYIDESAEEAAIPEGFLGEEEIEAAHIEAAVKIAQQKAADYPAEIFDHLLVTVEELKTGQHRQFKVAALGYIARRLGD